MKLLVAAALALGSCASPQKPAPPPADSPNLTMVEHTVKLEGCTGVEVARNVVVTAKHCLDDDAQRNDTYGASGVVWYVSPSYDFAVLVFTRYPFDYPPLPGTRLLRPLGVDYLPMRNGSFGEHVYAVGYPVQLGNLKSELTITDGIVAGPVEHDGQWRITAPIYFGNSGGGVWSEKGELVGISVSIYAADVEGSYPVPYEGQAFIVPISLVLPHLPIPQ